MENRTGGLQDKTICSKCGRPAVVFQAYSRLAFCKAHFERQLQGKFMRTVREFSMIRPNEHIAVALSGGKDSVVLLHLLHALKKRLPMELSAILVDEGIAGYRPHSVKTAQAECKKLGVKLHITSFKKEFGKSLDSILKARDGKAAGEGQAGGQSGGSGPDGKAIGIAGGSGQGGKNNRAVGACSFCGVFRRTLLNRKALEIGAHKLAVGHNLDDTAQTVMMNIMRNEPMRLARFGISGGVAESEGLVPRIKPLVRIPEKEIAVWAILHGIRIHFMQCPYAEEALRQEVRRTLNSLEEKYPGTKFRMLGSFLSMRPALMDMARNNPGGGIVECSMCGEPTSGGRRATAEPSNGQRPAGLCRGGATRKGGAFGAPNASGHLRGARGDVPPGACCGACRLLISAGLMAK